MKKPENNKKNEKCIKVASFGIPRVKMFDNGDVVFDLTLNGVTIYGCRVQEGQKGDFISFPSRKGGDGKYYSYAYAKLSDEDSKEILANVEAVLNESN